MNKKIQTINPKYPRILDLRIDVQNQFSHLSVGGTFIYRQQYPNILEREEIYLRPSLELLGTIVTNPDGKDIRLGICFKEGDIYKEDIIRVYRNKFEILHRGYIEEIDERYKGTHHGDKSFF